MMENPTIVRGGVLEAGEPLEIPSKRLAPSKERTLGDPIMIECHQLSQEKVNNNHVKH